MRASTLAPTPAAQTLEMASHHCGEVGVRLHRVLAADFPQSLQRRPAQILAEADATTEDLQTYLHSAGFSDLEELRHRVGKEVGRRLPEPDLLFTDRKQDRGQRSSLRQVLTREQDNLAQTFDALQTSGALELAANAILTSRHRWVIGDMKSAGYASLFATDLTAELRDVRLIQPTAADVVSAIADIQSKDTLTVFCFPNYSALTLRVAREYQARGAVVVAITDSYASPLSEYADHVLPVSTSSAAPTHSPTTVAAVGHILATLVAAGAKGATRRVQHRREIVSDLELYSASTVSDAGDAL